MRRKSLVHMAWLVCSITLLTGCQLLPEEESYNTAPIIRSYEAKEYTQATVLRGDLKLTTTVAVRYRASKKENLSFSVGGEFLEGVYVTEGQQVKAGDLLAELDQGDIAKEIEDLEYNLKVLSIENQHIQENWKLQLELVEAKYPKESQNLAYVTYSTRVNEEYGLKLQNNEDEQYIERMRLEELKEKQKSHQIFAGIDGSVTYIRKMQENQRSIEDATMITVADMTSTAFTISKEEDAVYFPVGTEVIIEKGNTEYQAVSVDAASLGLTEEMSKESAAYLKLVQPDPTLETGDSAKVTVVLDSREDVLYVNKDAVKTANGKQFVYILNEEGLKEMKDVTVGLEVDNVIEIVSGLNEGDSVVLD